MKLCRLFGINFDNLENISFKTFISSGHIHDSTVCFFTIIESLSFNRFSHRLWPTWSFWFNFGKTRSPAQHRKFDYTLQKQIFIERGGDEIREISSHREQVHNHWIKVSIFRSSVEFTWLTSLIWDYLLHFAEHFFFFINPETINLLNWESQWAVDWWRCAHNTRCPRISAHNSTLTPRRTLTGEKKNFLFTRYLSISLHTWASVFIQPSISANRKEKSRINQPFDWAKVQKSAVLKFCKSEKANKIIKNKSTKMVVDVKITREEGKPFGFRLIGGADFDIPLTCSKVSAYS